MSQATSGIEAPTRTVGGADVRKNNNKCKIPQRLGPNRLRTPFKSKFNNNQDPGNSKFEVTAVQHHRNAPRPHSAELGRPKSGGRPTDEPWTPVHPTQLTRHAHAPQRPDQQRPGLRRPSALPRKSINENLSINSRPGRQIITVPVSQKQGKVVPSIDDDCDRRPHRDTVCKYEQQAVCQSLYSNNARILDSNDEESEPNQSDKIMRLKIQWQEKIVQFENMKIHLHELQRGLVELYAALRLLHREMAYLGQKVKLPPCEHLRIMNIAKLSPEQLLQLCEGDSFANVPHMDVNLLYEMPAKIVATCEQTLDKRKEIVNWLEEIISEKMITKNSLIKKIDLFKTENHELRSILETNKDELTREINEAVDVLKKSINGSVVHQLRSEELTCKLSELNSVIEDLRKQLRTTEHRVSNKARLEELEKELKDEKCKKMVLRDRLSRAEGQMRMKEEKTGQLEAAWKQAQSKTLTLERTVLQLREENQSLQSNFDEQLEKLTESIRENTRNLEEIAIDREKLQTEKEDLAKRLTELSEHYNEALNNTKHENSVQIAKLIDTEKKCNEITEEKTKLESKIESLCTQLIESELRSKDLTKKLLEAESQLKEVEETQRELETIKRQLNTATIDLSEYKNLAARQLEAVNELERNFKKSVESEEMLRSNLQVKEEYISELEKQRTLLEQRLQESESKTDSYAEQLSSLQKHISSMQEDLGTFENLEELHKMVNQQRTQLQETTEKNKWLAEALSKKEAEVEQHLETLTEQGHLMEQRETVIAMLSEKNEEHANVIKLLRNNLEIRVQADIDLNQQIVEKNTEIETLFSNVETRKEQISQLEKIILALEDQNRKASKQKRKDRETISLLEKKVAECEAYYMANARNLEAPSDNLDHLINMLEHELGGPFEGQYNNKGQESLISRQKIAEENKHEKLNNFVGHENNDSSGYQSQRENIPTKIVMGNYVKKTYMPIDDQYKNDNLHRKKAITNIDTPKWFAPPDPSVNAYTKTQNLREKQFKGVLTKEPTRNMPFFCMPNHVVDEKKCKMFKLAGHRL